MESNQHSPANAENDDSLRQAIHRLIELLAERIAIHIRGQQAPTDR